MSRFYTLGLVFLIFSLLLSGCATAKTPEPTPSAPDRGTAPAEPLPMPPVGNGGGVGAGVGGGGTGTRTPLDPESLESIDLLQMESQPVQYMLQLKGYKSPCENLEYIVNAPNEDGEIIITAELVSTAEMCVAMAESFQLNINLGSFPAGKLYSVWLNGVKVAEFRP